LRTEPGERSTALYNWLQPLCVMKEESGTCSPLFLSNSVLAFALIGCQNKDQICFNLV